MIFDRFAAIGAVALALTLARKSGSLDGPSVVTPTGGVTAPSLESFRGLILSACGEIEAFSNIHYFYLVKHP